MNREIKFRGKRTDNGEWVYGDFLHGVGMHYGYSYILPNQQWLPRDCDPLDGYRVDPDSMGQYTGLKDKDGKGIYEGDIVNWLSIKNGGIGFVEEGIVEFRVNEQAYVVINRISTKDNRESVCNILRCRRDLKVVGNIYDNPELMKGGAE